ncbi:MAG: leucine-rich repeat protein [Clostridia bacterium]|nr:leucine-rich repeat protein [Clostridia bacterium]
MKKLSKKIIPTVFCFAVLLGLSALCGMVELDFDMPRVSSWFGLEAGAENTTSGTCGDNLTWEFDETTGTFTISGEGEMEDYNNVSSIPWCALKESIDTVVISSGVTRIGTVAFGECVQMKEITIPDSVTSIGGGAFYECDSLESVIVPDNVKEVGTMAFFNCTSLKHINLPAGLTCIEELCLGNCHSLEEIVVPENVDEIKMQAFTHCYNLKNIVFSEKLERIGDKAFYECRSLEALSLTDSVTSVGEFAFYGCSNLKTAGPKGGGYDYEFEWTESIPSYAFSGCYGLTSITIPDGVTSIGDSAFSGCTGLTSVTIGNSVTSIGDCTFYNCTRLTSVTIGNSVTSIGNSAFYNCAGLTSINIPDSVTSVGRYSFAYCTKLTSVNIGNGVTSIGGEAFYNCVGIKTIDLPDTVTIIGEDAFSLVCNVSYNGNATGFPWGARCVNGYNDGILIYSNSNKTKLIACVADSGSIIIPDTVTEISPYAFYECTGLTSVTIPDNVTSIGGFAFSGCTELKSVTIGNGVTGIGYYAFYGCPLEYVKMGSGLTSIPKDSSLIKKSLKTFIIGDSVTSIDSYVFKDCIGLTNITIPDSVTSIGNSAFSGCTGLKSVTIGNGVIGNYAFFGCTGLSNVVINDGVTSIGLSAFYGCTGLANVTIGNSVKSILDYAFYNCASLTSVTIPDSVKSIGSSAFSGCSGLVSITVDENNPVYYSSDNCVIKTESKTLVAGCKESIIPDDVTSIGQYAFHKCTGLTGITIPHSVTSIGNSAFSGCTGLTDITIPHSVTSIGTYAFMDVCNVLYNPETMTAAGSPWGARSVNGYVDGNLVYADSSKTELLACFTYASGTAVISASVKRIGDRVFLNCDKLTKILVKIIDSEPDWGKNVFMGCSPDLDVEYLPYGSGEIKGRPIYGDNGTRLIFCNKDRTEVFVLPDEVTVIEDNAFYGCKDIPSITLNDNLVKIGAHAFEGTVLYDEYQRDADGALYICGGRYLIDVKNNSEEAPDSYDVNAGCKVIAAEAFAGCDSLTSVSIPSSVIGIGHDAFAGCSGLETVNAACDDILYVGENAFADTAYTGSYVGSAMIRGNNAGNIKSGTTCIADYAFAGNTELKALTIPSGVKAIGTGAFEGCTNLTQVTFPDGLMVIGSNAFRDSGLAGNVFIPASVSNIGFAAFDGCEGVEGFTVADGNECYRSSDGVLFAGSVLVQYPPAKQGAEYTVPAGTGSVSDYAFSYAYNLEKVTIPGETQFRTLAFRNCNAVRDTVNLTGGMELSSDGTVLQQVTAEALDENGCFTVPSYVVMIAPESFNSVKELIKEIDLCNTAIIGDEVFRDCNNLTSVTGTDNLLYIGRDAFAGCDKLGSVELPPSAYFLPDSFCDGTEVTVTGNNRRLVIEKADTAPVIQGGDIHLSAKISAGEIGEKERVIWLDADTGEKYETEGPSLTITKAEHNINVSALLVDENGFTLLESAPVEVYVLANEEKVIQVHDENGKNTSEITAVKNDPVTVTLMLNGWDNSLDGIITTRWFVNGKEVKEAKSKTVCVVKDVKKDFRVKVQFEYKGHVFKETEEYTVKINLVSEPESGSAVLTAADSESVTYRTKVTVTASVKNLPAGCCLAIYEKGGKEPLKKAKEEETFISYNVGEMKSSKTFTVKVIDKAGNVQKNPDKSLMQKDVEITVTGTGFFQRIIAFFKYLFSPVPTKTVGPKVK